LHQLVEVLTTLLPAKELSRVNVNFPADPRGTLWMRQSVRHYNGKRVPGEDRALDSTKGDDR
jgi:5'-nucleotidase